MKPAVRRALIFAAVLGTGVGAVLYFEEQTPDTQAPIAAYGTAEPEQGETLGLRDSETDEEMQIDIGILEFVIYESYRLPSGELERRPAYDVRITDGKPDDAGGYVVLEPSVTALDLETGERLGTLRGDRGRFESQDTLLDGFLFNPSGLKADAFQISGNVVATQILDDGTTATLETEELFMEGEVIRAPGHVVWTREDMRLTGEEMSWDGAMGVLVLSRDAELQMLGDTPRTRGVLHSPEGLLWQSELDDETRGYVLLNGPVTGSSEDGAALEARRVTLTDEARAVTLEGEAFVQLVRDGVTWDLRAASLTARRTEDGLIELTRAEGGVTLVSDGEDGGTWFETDRLDGQGSELVALGPVRGGRGSLTVTGTGLRLDQTTGAFEIPADVRIAQGSHVDDPLAGALLDSPGGMRSAGPAGSRRIHFAGPVRGEAPALGDLSAATMDWDEFTRELHLEGDVAFFMQEPDGRRRRLEGQTVHVALDETGGLTALECRTDALLEEFAVDGSHTRLTGPHVVASSTLLEASQEFELTWRGLSVTGRGLRVDQRNERVDVAEAAHVVRPLTGEGDEVEALGEDVLTAATGLTWWLPDEDGGAAEEGHGELRGPVVATLADGTRLEADSVVLEGEDRRMTLRGDALLDWGEGGRIESDELVVSGEEGARVVEAPGPVTWSLGLLSGSGTGLLVEEAKGRVLIERDVLFRYPDITTGSLGELRCAGTFEWNAPPGAVDPFGQGRGELRDRVEGSDGAGGGLLADRLVLDMPARRVDLHGECAVQRVRDGSLITLTTEPDGFVSMTMGETMGPADLSVRGRGTLTMDTMRVEADTMDWDAAEDHVVLQGDCRLLAGGLWTHTNRVDVWPEAMRWVVPQSVTVLDDER